MAADRPETLERAQKDKAPAHKMEYYLVALFGSVIGLTGLSAFWRQTSDFYDVPAGASNAL